MREKAFFISDLHLGAHHPGSLPNREKYFCDFLQLIQPQASHLFLLGDLFEFWMEYAHFIPKDHFAVLAQFHSLSTNGVEIHYLSGNHDFNLGSFFHDKLGVFTHHHPLSITLQEKSLYIFHGDGMVKSDWKYHLIKKILIHPLANWGFKLLHPDWGMKLAKGIGGMSHTHPNYKLRSEYEKAGTVMTNTGEFDIVIHGHTHRAFIKQLDHGVYINTGAWLERLQYVQMEKGKCFLKTYSPGRPAGE